MCGMISPGSSEKVTVQGVWKPEEGLGFDEIGTGRHCRREGRE